MQEEKQEATVLDNIQKAGLKVDKNGKPVQTIGNCIKALMAGDKNLVFRFNELTGKTEISGAWWDRDKSPNLNDTDMVFIRLHLEQRYGLAGEKSIPRAIEYIANISRYHPVKEFLNSLEYDGGNYIETLFPRFLGCEKSDYTTEATKLLMMGAIHRIFSPGSKFEVVVCLVEPKQGGGKSTMVRYLAHNDEWFTDELKHMDRENAFSYLQGRWIVEFSEMLATANARSIEDIKQFISRQKDFYRTPYDRYGKDYARQCIFVGTTNNIAFLPSDKTGNRRFIPLRVHSERAELHPVEHEKEAREHVTKAWAEAMHLYNSGNYSLVFPQYLQKELGELRRTFEPEDPKVGIIQEWLDNCKHEAVCTSIIYYDALKGIGEPKRYQLTEIAEIMDLYIDGWQRHDSKSNRRKFKKYGSQVSWDRVHLQGGCYGSFQDVSVEEQSYFV